MFTSSERVPSFRHAALALALVAGTATLCNTSFAAKPRPTSAQMPLGKKFGGGRTVEFKFNMKGVDGWREYARGAWVTAATNELYVQENTPSGNGAFVHLRLGFDGYCHVAMSLGVYDGAAYVSRSYDGDYRCYNTSFDDESSNGGNNNGLALIVPELNLRVWAKREDRVRLAFASTQYPNVFEEWELDTQE